MEEVYSYARRLATALAERHWPENTEWKPLPDTLGVLTQIDNMCTLMDDQKREIERLRSALTAVRDASPPDAAYSWGTIKLAECNKIASAALASFTQGREQRGLD